MPRARRGEMTQADARLSSLPTTGTSRGDSALTSRATLKVLLVTSGRTIPTWLFECLKAVEQSGVAQVVLVWLATPTEVRGPVGLTQRLRRLCFSLYESLDRHLFRRRPDALAPIALHSALPHCPVLERAELQPALVGSPIDLVLDPFSQLSDGFSGDFARYGVWSTTFGRSGDPRTQSTPGFWEVIEGRPSTETRLCVRWRGCAEKVSLYLSVAPTDRRSVSRSRNNVYWKVSAALVRNVQKLWEDPEAFLETLQAATPFAAARGPSRPPGNLAVLRAGTRLLRRYVADKGASALYREQWALAYHRGAGQRPGMGAFRMVIPPRDRIWADPLPVQVGNDSYIFHEELLRSTGKGTIVLTVVDHSGAVAPPVPILEKGYHLSYPCVFQWDGDWFMVPETASQNQVELYRCVEFPARWKLERVVLSGLRAFDPTPAFLFGKWWLFATIPAYGAGINDELHLFSADAPVGPWTPHRNNPIKSDVHSARPAGRILERHGQFYRPAQDCSTRYGYAVSINHILQLNPEIYEEREVDRIIPNWEPNVVGVHTLNVAGDMTVVDFLLRRKRFGADFS